jgi:SAM-dependent methyltransferase
MTLRSRAIRRLRKRGRLPSLGQDYDRGHLEYVARMGPEGERWLRTKPFSAPPNYELARCLHTFAHIVSRLQLPARAQVLDVGCGPGWVSEYLARCGYWVTGIDVSPEMVEIARARVAAIEGPIGPAMEAQAEFHAMHVREMPWRSRFDAAILYDTMHHFDDELETLQVIRSTLVPGGLLYLDEGVRPEPGSAGEQTLIDEMKAFGTLESPFDPEYLAGVVEEAGFVQVQRLLVVDELIDLDHSKEALDRLSKRARRPDTNTLIAQNPSGTGEEGFAGRIEARGGIREAPDGLVVTLVVTNSGSSFWPGASQFPFPAGTISVGPYVLETGERVELPRVPLPHSVAAGGVAQVEVGLPREALADRGEVAFDLVREGIAWFSEPASPLLVLPLP